MGLEQWQRLASSVQLPSPIEYLHDSRLKEKGVNVWLKRDDLIHPEVPGNKWRKLKYNIIEAVQGSHHTLLTFGGAYSNHIRATAAAGYYCNLATIGIIRGEQHLPLNPVLAYANFRGMQLSYMDRIEYRRRSDPDLIAELRREHGEFYLVPEGGTNELGVRGCSEISTEIDIDFDVICCPVGSGGTLAGIASSIKAEQQAIGFSSIKGGEYLTKDVVDLQRRTFGHSTDNWRIEHGFHFGGFAKRKAELNAFTGDFLARHDMALEWVYVAKMMYGVYALTERGVFAPGSRIVVVVTGPSDLD